MKVLTLEEHTNLKKFHCDKGKHRFRENKFGVTWCVICGHLSYNNIGAEPLTDNDKITIKCN